MATTSSPNPPAQLPDPSRAPTATSSDPIPTPYPAPSRTASTSIHGLPTTATSHLFSTHILLTLSQNGRLAHWLHCPLSRSPTTPSQLPLSVQTEDVDTALLPETDVTVTTVLGGNLPGLDTLAQTLVASVATAIRSRPGAGASLEGRLLVMGVGLDRSLVGSVGGEEFAELVGLCLDVL